MSSFVSLSNTICFSVERCIKNYTEILHIGKLKAGRDRSSCGKVQVDIPRNFE